MKVTAATIVLARNLTPNVLGTVSIISGSKVVTVTQSALAATVLTLGAIVSR
ncbi:hypothetical protein ACQKMV_00820 [Lysinibacillus sp. NPDC094403]|uniref:hypothetical protein n=1 Tax=Lysinibacillus sp. NPDC094403 TaxID=3390581 RepID=UPI003D0353F8